MESRFKELLTVLNGANIDYVVVGGFAAVLHGVGQITHDVDICVSMAESNLEKLRQALAPYHPKHRMTPQKLSFLEHPSDLKNIKNLYLTTDLGILDILGEISGVGGFEATKKDAEAYEVFGLPVQVLGLDALIAAKKCMSRPKDLAVLRELLVIKEGRS
ncbi:nucleotidyltransferase [bacterium]|nr:nucleotidyltransferase [bacterium]